MNNVETLRQWIAESRRPVFFGGAGVSTESGIPDYRSVDGLYHQKFDYPPETILSHDFFFKHTDYFYRFYREKMMAPDAKPNRVHTILAKLGMPIITQNIDGLHQKAGSKTVFELHGSVNRNFCRTCGKFHDAAYILAADGIPRCDCGGLIKPDVVLYGEGLDEDCVMGAVDAIAQADLLIVGGTSLTVYPAAGLIRYYRGSRLVLINKEVTTMDSQADLVLHMSLGQALEEATREIDN